MAEKGTGACQRCFKQNFGALTVTEQAGAGSLVQTNKTQVPYDPHSGSPRNTFDVLCELALDLQANLDDLQRVCKDLSQYCQHMRQTLRYKATDHLTSTSHTTSQDLSWQLDVSRVLVRQLSAH